MKTIVITAIIVFLIDMIGGLILTKHKKNKQRFKDEIFLTKIDLILSSDLSRVGMRNEINQLCRNTDGDCAYGVYMMMEKLKL